MKDSTHQSNSIPTPVMSCTNITLTFITDLAGAVISAAAAIYVGWRARQAAAVTSFKSALYAASSLPRNAAFHSKAHAVLIGAATSFGPHTTEKKYAAIKALVDDFGQSDPKQWDRQTNEAYVKRRTEQLEGHRDKTPEARFEALVCEMIKHL